ncbi:MAG TPA: histidinol dehydrogenase [Acidimicrobiales bacterium]|nr:histidinol dehydrogenase [Acidimicrobiales bacterium]
MLRTLDLRGRPPGSAIELPRPDLGGAEPVAAVREILAGVRARGDAALREYTLAFDGVRLDELRVDDAAVAAAPSRIDPDLRLALEAARDAVASFHEHRPSPPPPFRRAGITVRRLDLPVERVGVYAPGGRAKYPSSVLMTAVPARVAGVGAIACCVPPSPDGSVADELLAAAAIAGVDEVYRVGGAQAIGAMAYGTESIAKVDVVVGPGSRWVSIAQREVRGVVGVPAAFAGPSEVVVVADASTPVDYAAIDLVVQAEHGPDGLAWLVTWSPAVAAAVRDAVARLVAASPRGEETSATLAQGGYAVLVDGPEEALAVANAIAPEHLELLTADPEALVPLVRHAGAVFLGPLAPASIGDYLAGPSHVLPTFATARFASALGVEDFVRRAHVIEVSTEGMEGAWRHVAALATAEGLPAHAESVRLRAGRATWGAR